MKKCEVLPKSGDVDEVAATIAEKILNHILSQSKKRRKTMIKKDVSCVVCGELTGDDFILDNSSEINETYSCNVIVERKDEHLSVRHSTHLGCDSILLRGTMEKDEFDNITIILKSKDEVKSLQIPDLEVEGARILKLADKYINEEVSKDVRIKFLQTICSPFPARTPGQKQLDMDRMAQ